MDRETELAEAFNDALEQAARLVDAAPDEVDLIDLALVIRALKRKRPQPSPGEA